MSIHRMISLHPDIADNAHEARDAAARHAMYCAQLCTGCADACLAEDMDMRQCIRACLDCADVCAATARLAMRHTGRDEEVLRIMLHACARVCDRCADECHRHDHAHCRLCAEMCRECAASCRAAMAEAQ